MTTFGSVRSILLASLVSSAGFCPSCVVSSDDHEEEGGSDSAGGNSIAGSTSGAGPTAGVSGSIGGAGGSAGSAAGSIDSTGGAVGGVAGSIGCAGGSVAGIAGSIGAGGSAAGVGGAIAGVGGWFGEAGSISGGDGESAGNGGSNVAGSEATGAGGPGNGGLGGASSGGASGSAAGGACGGADTGCGGTSGGAGASASAGSAGSNGDPSLPLLLSTKVITFPATECGTVPTVSNTFTITNPSSVTKTWRASAAGAFAFLATPSGSSLSPGEVVTVSVKPPFVPAGSLPNGSSPLMTGALVVVEGASLQSMLLSQPIAGAFYAWTPANLNFGVVNLNSSATVHLTQSGDSSGRAMGDNPAFVASISPTSWHEWTFTFVATAVGTQTATFTWQSVPNHFAACTPNTFTATATVPAPAR